MGEGHAEPPAVRPDARSDRGSSAARGTRGRPSAISLTESVTADPLQARRPGSRCRLRQGRRSWRAPRAGPETGGSQEGPPPSGRRRRRPTITGADERTRGRRAEPGRPTAAIRRGRQPADPRIPLRRQTPDAAAGLRRHRDHRTMTTDAASVSCPTCGTRSRELSEGGIQFPPTQRACVNG